MKKRLIPIRILRSEHGRADRKIATGIAILFMATIVVLLVYVLVGAGKSPFNMIFNRSKFMYVQKSELADTYLYAKNYKKAKPLLEEMIKLRPKEPMPHSLLGVVYAKLNFPDNAIAEFQKATSLDPSFHEAYANLAALYEQFALESSRKDDMKSAKDFLLRAEKEIEKALEISPHNARYLQMQKDIIDNQNKIPK